LTSSGTVVHLQSKAMDRTGITREQLETMRIKDLLDAFPETAAVLYNHFGASCFGCPAVQKERLETGVLVHQADADHFYRDVMEEIQSVRTEKLD
jgi:hypothetical protein